MSDGLLIALASISAASITVGVPLIIAAFNTRKIVKQANDHAEVAAQAAKTAADLAAETKTTIGVKNGNGDLMTMAARALGENAEIFKQLLELYNYTHFNIHEIYNAMTAKFGQIDILWERAGLPPMPSNPNPPKYTPMAQHVWPITKEMIEDGAEDE